MIEQLPIAAKLASEQTFDLLAAYWRLILWPVSRLVSDKANAKCRLTPAGQLPDRIAYIMPGDLRQLATIAGVSAESAWRDGATDGTDQRRLISGWLMRHTKDQLHKLRGELNVTEGSSTMAAMNSSDAFSMPIDLANHCPCPNASHRSTSRELDHKDTRKTRKGTHGHSREENLQATTISVVQKLSGMHLKDECEAGVKFSSLPHYGTKDFHANCPCLVQVAAVKKRFIPHRKKSLLKRLNLRSKLRQC